MEALWRHSFLSMCSPTLEHAAVPRIMNFKIIIKIINSRL